MIIDEKLKEKLLKIKALAEQGVGGERENAQRILKKMCESNGINIDDLSDIEKKIKRKYEIKSYQKGFLSNVIVSIIGRKKLNECGGLYSIMIDRKKRYFYELECDPYLILQIKTAMDHYIALYDENKKKILSSLDTAFCVKYNLWNIDQKDEIYTDDNDDESNFDIFLIQGLTSAMKSDHGPLIGIK